MPQLRAKSISRQASGKQSSRRPTTAPARKLPGISRIDHGRTHGWFARLGWRATARGTRPRFVAFFGDFSYGTKAAARKAAEKWVRFVLKNEREPAIKP